MTAILSFLINVWFFIVLLPISIPMFVLCLILSKRLVMTIGTRRVVILSGRS